MFVDFIFLGLFFGIPFVFAENIPQYIKPCARNDPNLSKCVQKTANDIIKEFSKEDLNTGLKSLDPLYIGSLQISNKKNNKGIGINIKNSYIQGLSGADFKNISVDLKKREIFTKFTTPKLILTGDYVVDGRILLIPITGEGNLTITIRDTECEYLHRFDFYKDKLSGNDHIKINVDDLACSLGQSIFQLNNLFGGNKQLGDNMNRILSQNWKEVLKEMSPPVVDAIRKGAKNRINDFYRLFSYASLLPEASNEN